MATTSEQVTRSLETSSAHEGLPARLMALAGITVTLCLVAGGLVLDQGLLPDAGLELLIWTLATVGASFATITMGPSRPSLAMDLPVLLACSFSLGPVAGGIVALLGATSPNELKGRLSLSRSAWNHAQTSLSVMAAGFVFAGLGGQVGDWPAPLLAACAAILADATINYVSVGLMTAVSEQRPLSSVLHDMVIGSPLAFGVLYAAFALTSLLVTEAYKAVGPLSLVVAIAPVVLARQAFLGFYRLERVGRQLRRRGAALTRVDERIAEERRDERARIAESLHDDVLQALYTVTLHAHVIREDYRAGKLLDLEGDVPPLVDAAERASALLRETIHGLRRSPVGRAGLVETARLLIAHMKDQTGIRIASDIDIAIRADPAVELLVYQVLREALTNAARHSQAENLRVTLMGVDGGIYLAVLDDGVGFDADQDREDDHFGLDLMAERACAAGGTVSVVSRRGRGTSVEAWFRLRLGQE
jgi:signal transduction histidine kinase